MPFQSKKAALRLSGEERDKLSLLSRSRMEPSLLMERAKILLSYANGQHVSGIARERHTNRPKIERCINKALELGAIASLKDLSGRGRKPVISAEARAWIVSVACQKPKDLGYSYELWTTNLLAKHIREHCKKKGYPSLSKLSRGTVSKILSKNKIRPHKINYYLQRRDPEFDMKMAQVLCVYKEVAILREKGEKSSSVAILSYDEKPGIQAIENTAPDLPPVPFVHPTISRDYEYVRHGTVSLMAGIDLLSGRIHGMVTDRHRSREFIDFLQKLHQFYPKEIKIRIIMDNHSAHISKETRTYLSTLPNRFDFIFTPKHGSWLNLIESFFGKMARSMLRGIRVSSKSELIERIHRYLNEINETPVIFRWKYRLESIAVV